MSYNTRLKGACHRLVTTNARLHRIYTIAPDLVVVDPVELGIDLCVLGPLPHEAGDGLEHLGPVDLIRPHLCAVKGPVSHAQNEGEWQYQPEPSKDTSGFPAAFSEAGLFLGTCLGAAHDALEPLSCLPA